MLQEGEIKMHLTSVVRFGFGRACLVLLAEQPPSKKCVCCRVANFCKAKKIAGVTEGRKEKKTQRFLLLYFYEEDIKAKLINIAKFYRFNGTLGNSRHCCALPSGTVNV